jgi:hypothetical protein
MLALGTAHWGPKADIEVNLRVTCQRSEEIGPDLSDGEVRL